MEGGDSSGGYAVGRLRRRWDVYKRGGMSARRRWRGGAAAAVIGGYWRVVFYSDREYGRRWAGVVGCGGLVLLTSRVMEAHRRDFWADPARAPQRFVHFDLSKQNRTSLAERLA